MSKTKKGKGRPSIWTDELVEQLLKLWQQGLSAADIARELGHDLSRNAVIGKIHRLRAAGKAVARRENDNRGKARAGTKSTRAGTPRESRQTTAAHNNTAAATAQAVAMKAQPAPQAQSAPEKQLKVVSAEEGLVKDIMDLTHHSCRWPIGTPGEDNFAYCGRRAADGGPYCRHHAAVAYTSMAGSQKRAAG